MICKSCGTEINETQKYCPRCGAQISNASSTKNKAPKNSKSKKLKVLIACVCCLALVICATIGTVVWKKYNSPQLSESDENYVYLDGGFSDIEITDSSSALEAISSVKDMIGIENAQEELKPSSMDTVTDHTYYRFQQYYKDIPVYGRSVVLMVDSDNRAAYLTSNYMRIDSYAADQEISSNYDRQLAFYGEDFTLCEIAYEQQEYNTYMVFRDANSGVAIGEHCLTYTDTEYDYSYEQADGSFLLYDEERNLLPMDSVGKVLNPTWEHIGDSTQFYFKRVFYTGSNENQSRNMQNADFYMQGEKLDFDIYINDDIQFITAANEDAFAETPVVLMENLQAVYDFYKTLGRNGFDGHKGKLYVSYNDRISNDTKGKNAYSSSGNLLSFGSAMDVGQIDLIAHEFAHSVEYTISSMRYEGESGAIMEAYSDIFGELVEGYYNDGKMDWVHCPSMGNRSLKDPLSTENPAKYNGEHWGNTTNLKLFGESMNDSGNVHNNSTVISHAAYLMWNGGEAGLDIFKIDVDTLARLWYQSLFLLHEDATFNQCANAVIFTAQNLYDDGELTQAQLACVRRAFESVGIYADMLSSLSVTTSNGASTEVYDINGNILSSYYLEIEDASSQTVTKGEFTSANPYVVDLEANNVYIFAVKALSSSEAEYRIKVRVIDFHQDNAVLKLQTALHVEEAVTESYFGNVISYNDCLYYWKYNSASFEDTAVFGEYSYAQDVENQLICRDANGTETVVLETNGAGEIAISNDRIFYQAPTDSLIVNSIYTCELDGSDVIQITAGNIESATNNGYIIITKQSDSRLETQICSIDSDSLEMNTIAQKADFLLEYDDIVYFQQRESDDPETYLGKTILAAVNANGQNSTVLYTTQPDLYNEDDYAADSDMMISYSQIINPYIQDGFLYYAYGGFAGTGNVFQGGKIAKVSIDGSGGEIICDLNDSALFLVDSAGNVITDPSLVKSTSDQPYIHDGTVSFYNQNLSAYEDCIVREDYSDFSSYEISNYRLALSDDHILQVEYIEKIENDIYFMLHESTYNMYSAENQNAGMREYYERAKSALFKKNLSSGTITKIYEIGAESNQSGESIFDAYVDALEETEDAFYEGDTSVITQSPQYFLYDMNNDGTKELIISSIKSMAECSFTFYTYNNGVQLLGTIVDTRIFAALPNNGDGIYLYVSFPAGETYNLVIDRVTIENNQLRRSDEVDEEVDLAVQNEAISQYYNPDDAIEMFDVNDYSGLSEYIN